MTTLEDVILAQDRRGVAALRPYLPTGFCEAAARFLLAHTGTVLIATGFYVQRADAPETDGPPGALALGRALEALGNRVVYVSDAYAVPLLADLAPDDTETVDFPIADDATSREVARDLLDRIAPTALIAIERCGLTRSGTYLNMRGQDISPHTARLDHLFLQHPHSVGIGDGGNEIGMGNLASHIPEMAALPDEPTRHPHDPPGHRQRRQLGGVWRGGRVISPGRPQSAAAACRRVGLHSPLEASHWGPWTA